MNKGWTCVKGRFGFDYVHSPDRLTEPLIKENGKFRQASWDEALDRVAEGLKKVKAKHGADAIGVLVSAKCTNEENYLLQKIGPCCPGHEQRGPLRPSLTQLHRRRSGDGIWKRGHDQFHRRDQECGLYLRHRLEHDGEPSGDCPGGQGCGSAEKGQAHCGRSPED